MERRAKIVATIGPSSSDEITLQKLIQAGMNVARLNFSHGSHEEHARVVSRIRLVSKRLGIPICILQDLQGPKIRTGELSTDGVSLKPGETITLSVNVSSEDPSVIPIDYEDLPQLVKPGNRILLDDGKMELQVRETTSESIKAKVITGGILKSHKGINLPGANLSIPGFTEKDEEDLKFGLELGVDVVAISFVRDAQDISRVRQALGQLSSEHLSTPIIAKLERPEALNNLDEIVEATDGVMVARGDLGVEMSPQAVPIAQKRIIDAANHKNKIVITATQMLESMIENVRPTRAEASDVANAIFDGTDAAMLSGETSIGKYPVESVQMMDAIICEAEAHMKEWGHLSERQTPVTGDDAESITRAGRELAHDLNVAAIAVFTTTGRTARLMSKAFPRAPILGFTPEHKTYNRMALYWGVFPYQVPYVNSIEEMIDRVENAMIASTPIKPGQQVVLISGFPVGGRKPPNIALLHTVGRYS
jgi:pyruvate kinase